MQTIQLKTSEPLYVGKGLSVTGPMADEAENIEFKNTQIADSTPVMLNGRQVGLVPRQNVIANSARIRCTHSQVTDKSILPMLNQKLISGCTIQPLEVLDGIVVKSRLLSFDIYGQGSKASSTITVTRDINPNLSDEDERLAESIFQAGRNRRFTIGRTDLSTKPQRISERTGNR